MDNRQRCDILLQSLFPNQPHLIEKWWESPNKAFDKSSPKEILDRNPEMVVQYLYQQFNGDYK